MASHETPDPKKAPVMSAPPAQTNSEVINTAKDHLVAIGTGVQKLTTVDIQKRDYRLGGAFDIK